jgi:hypothetical protein
MPSQACLKYAPILYPFCSNSIHQKSFEEKNNSSDIEFKIKSLLICNNKAKYRESRLKNWIVTSNSSVSFRNIILNFRSNKINFLSPFLNYYFLSTGWFWLTSLNVYIKMTFKLKLKKVLACRNNLVNGSDVRLWDLN